jgi:hypothetical protein
VNSCGVCSVMASVGFCGWFGFLIVSFGLAGETAVWRLQRTSRKREKLPSPLSHCHHRHHSSNWLLLLIWLMVWQISPETSEGASCRYECMELKRPSSPMQDSRILASLLVSEWLLKSTQSPLEDKAHCLLHSVTITNDWGKWLNYSGFKSYVSTYVKDSQQVLGEVELLTLPPQP